MTHNLYYNENCLENIMTIKMQLFPTTISKRKEKSLLCRSIFGFANINDDWDCKQREQTSSDYNLCIILCFSEISISCCYQEAAASCSSSLSTREKALKKNYTTMSIYNPQE